jgi:hypothetical protein
MVWGFLTQNDILFKDYELFISGIFHLIFSDSSWLQVTEIMASDTVDKEDNGVAIYLGANKR